jgi:hypothetical protein
LKAFKSWTAFSMLSAVLVASRRALIDSIEGGLGYERDGLLPKSMASLPWDS